MKEPNFKDLKICINQMANSMKLSSLPDFQANQLINHVLLKEKYDSVAGKEGWESFLKNLITERELRNLLIAHTASKIAKHNKNLEPNFNKYSTKELCQNFDLALFGKTYVPKKTDTLDPWEINSA